MSGRQEPDRPGPAVSVVIPVYNEEANLEALYERLERVLEAASRGPTR